MQSCPLYAPQDAPLGSIITFTGYASKPSNSLTKAAKAWRQLEKDCSFYVNDEGIACFDPRPLSQREKQSDVQSAGPESDRPSGIPGVPFSVYIDVEDISLDRIDTSTGTRSPARRYTCSSTVIGRIV